MVMVVVYVILIALLDGNTPEGSIVCLFNMPPLHQGSFIDIFSVNYSKLIKILDDSIHIPYGLHTIEGHHRNGVSRFSECVCV